MSFMGPHLATFDLKYMRLLQSQSLLNFKYLAPIR